MGENAGFSGGTPWIKVNPNYRHINAALQQRDEYSTLSCYKRLLRLRRELSVFTDGAFDLLLEEDEELFAYTRTNADTRLLVICNFYGNTVTNPLCETVRSMRCIFCTDPEGRDPALLRPYEARIYLS